MSWYVTTPASPYSYAQWRVHDGPMAEDEAKEEARKRGDRYRAQSRGELQICKLEEAR